ncbi:DNA internalization-related competence protein ComEC/Rec2 [Chitinimonas lacunae]|uniref:DNA internalization-related competence protein ComEC/Rec2 n=1 Tax=Chitinimonas lacunae TaxID=1963018 RepID=A0ABV8MWC0_9NEIS
MQPAIIAFALGICLLQRSATLGPSWPWLLAAAVLLCCPVRSLRPGALLLAALLGGLGYANWRAEGRLATRLDPAWENRPLNLSGSVISLVERREYGQRFRFAPDDPRLPARLLLTDYRPSDSQPWAPGQRWLLSLRLRRPHGSQNPGAADYEAWLLGENLGATANVGQKGRQLLAAWTPTPTHWLHRLRSALAEHIRHALAGRRYAEVMVALAVGDQSGIATADWTLFRRSGLTHLVSISGLHVTLIAGLAGALAARLWRCSAALAGLLPARRAGAFAAVVAAAGYAALAGFAVPCQRTLYMVSVAALALLSGRRLAASTIWCLALLVVLLLDPWAVLSAGFWLSFLTVAALVFALNGRASGQRGWRHRLMQWGWSQWAATLGSLPLLALWFRELPILSPLANALAIPVVSVVVTPLALLGSVEPSGSALRLGHEALALCLSLVEFLARHLPPWRQTAPPLWTLLPASLAVLALLLPRGLPGRVLAPLALLPLLSPPRPLLAAGQAEAIVLDVDQGLSVLVRTANHALLFDTGTAGQGARAVPAVLGAAGVTRLDLLLLSHDDADHLGAAATVLDTVTVGRLLGAAPRGRPTPAHQPCRRGQRWQWDGVEFAILHPRGDETDDNAASCVLRVATAGGRLLIPADIGRAEEARLLADDPAALKAEVVVMPHHGSAASSSPDFVAAVGARLAIAPSGYLNRFRHPRPEVVARYRAGGATVWRSDRDGAVLLQLGRQGWQAQRWREQARRYWHAQEEAAQQ